MSAPFYEITISFICVKHLNKKPLDKRYLLFIFCVSVFECFKEYFSLVQLFLFSFLLV